MTFTLRSKPHVPKLLRVLSTIKDLSSQTLKSPKIPTWYLPSSFHSTILHLMRIFGGKMVNFVASVGVLILQKLQKLLLTLNYLNIQILVSSSTLPSSIHLEKIQSAFFCGSRVLQNLAVFVPLNRDRSVDAKIVFRNHRSQFSRSIVSKITAWFFVWRGSIGSLLVREGYSIEKSKVPMFAAQSR